MNSIIGEMDLTKYFILLIFPFFLLYIFKFFLNQSFVRKSNIPKRELKEQNKSNRVTKEEFCILQLFNKYIFCFAFGNGYFFRDVFRIFL